MAKVHWRRTKMAAGTIHADADADADHLRTAYIGLGQRAAIAWDGSVMPGCELILHRGPKLDNIEVLIEEAVHKTFLDAYNAGDDVSVADRQAAYEAAVVAWRDTGPTREVE